MDTKEALSLPDRASFYAKRRYHFTVFTANFHGESMETIMGDTVFAQEGYRYGMGWGWTSEAASLSTPTAALWRATPQICRFCPGRAWQSL